MKSSVTSKMFAFAAVMSSLLLISCENFMQGAEAKKLLEEQVDYAKSTSCNLSLYTDYGTIKNAANRSVKVTDKFSTEFFENDSGYQFVKWTVTPSGAVSFSDETASAVDFTVTSAASDIVVKPLLYKRPMIVTCSPDGSQATYPKDTVIKLIFSENISENADLSALKISCDYTDYTEHFSAPVISQNVITIAPDRNNPVPIEKGTQKTLTVSVPASVFYETPEAKIYIKDPYIFSYTINSENDKTAPVVLDFKIAKTPDNLEAGTNLFSQGLFKDTVAAVGKENFFVPANTVSSVHFSFKATDTDTGSGISHLLVRERVLYDTDGNALTDKTSQKIIYLNDCITDTIAEGTMSYKFDAVLSDGITELDFSFVDNSGNESDPFTYSFIKDLTPITNFNLQYGPVCLESDYSFIHKDDITGNYKFIDEIENGRIIDSMSSYIDLYNYYLISIPFSDPMACFEEFKYVEKIDDISIKTELLDESNNVIETKTQIYKATLLGMQFNDKDSIVSIYHFDNIDKNKIINVRFILTDAAGNTQTQNFKINAVPKLVETRFVEEPDNEKYFYLYFSHEPNFYNTIKIWWSKTNEEGIWSEENNSYSAEENFGGEPNQGYRIPVDTKDDIVYLYITSSNSSNFIQPSALITINGAVATGTDGHKPDFTYSLEPERIKNSTNNILKINLENFESYDSATIHFIDYYQSDSFSDYTSFIYPITSAETSVVLNALEMWKFNFYITVEKDNNIYTSDIETVCAENLTEDYQAPVIDKNNTVLNSYYRNALLIKFLDYPSQTIDNLLDEDGNILLYYSYLGTSRIMDISMSEAEMKELSYKSISLKPQPKSKEELYYTVEFPLAELNIMEDSGVYYVLVFYLKDNNGNDSYNLLPVLTDFQKVKQSVIYGSDGILQKIIGVGNSAFNYGLYQYFSENNWVTDNGEFFEKDFTVTASGNATFFKLVPKLKNSFPAYCYSRKTECYVKSMEASRTATTNNKKCDRIKVLHDQPVFIHRLVCPVSFGDDIDSWEKWTLESQKQEEQILKLNNIYTYQTSIDCFLDSIPSGNYYCYVAYFADNTRQISQVFYKE